MGRTQRIKGQRGEREAIGFLREHGVGCEERLLGQERDGGYDLETDAGPCEVKRRKKLPAYMIPREGVAYVMARQDYGRWYVVLDAEAWCRLWLRDRERTKYADAPCGLCGRPYHKHGPREHAWIKPGSLKSRCGGCGGAWQDGGHGEECAKRARRRNHVV